MNADTKSDNHWRGVPLTELYGSQSPWGAPEFPLVAPSFNHAVLYHVPSSGCVTSDRPPKPQIGQDKWDSEHVRMPCSSHSLYPVEDSTGETFLKKRWEMIENALSKPLRNSYDLANAIISYNTKFKNIWKFEGLHNLFNEHLEVEESLYFFDVTLPEVVKLALALPKLVQAPIPLLKQHKNRSVSLSQQQIASLLANAFFCTFPRRNSRKTSSEYATYPHINFNTSRLYESIHYDSNMEKLKCLCHYFRRVVTKAPTGTVTYTRRSVPPRAFPSWAESRRSLATLPLHVDSRNTIEDAHGLIQVDFANKYLGGGVLGRGCVQEEIRFVICPELLLSMLFTEELKPNEALVIIGCERYSRYAGYGSSFHWAGDYSDVTPRDSAGRRRTAVLAIDAVPTGSPLREFRTENITRELNKAWVGVSFDTEAEGSGSVGLRLPGVATGNWGCGAFGGTPHLKSLLQLMASAQADRPVAYYTFGDDQLRDDIVHIYNLLARYDVTVGELFKHIVKFSENRKDVLKGRLHAYLEEVLKGSTPPSPELFDEQMDTSVTEAVPETVIEIESSINDSPELFSQDEMDQSLIDTTVQTEIEHKVNNSNELTNKLINNKIESNNLDTRRTLCDAKRKLEESCNSPNSSKVFAPDSQDNENIVENSPNCLKSLLDTIQNIEGGSNSTTEIQKTDKECDESTSNVRHSLFDAIQRLDEEPNSSIASPSLGNKNKNVTSNDCNLSLDCEEKSSSAVEAKKKIGKKITDYFSKKTT